MTIGEKILDILKDRVFDGNDFGDFFSLKTRAADYTTSTDCFISINIGESEHNEKIFGRLEGKLCKNGGAQYDTTSDFIFCNKWVDSFLSDIDTWINENIYQYLRKLYNKKCAVKELDSVANGFSFGKEFIRMSNFYVMLRGDIGEEKIAISRDVNTSSTVYHLKNFISFDEYSFKLDENDCLCDGEIERFQKAIAKEWELYKVGELFYKGDQLCTGENNCEIIKNNDNSYIVNFHYLDIWDDRNKYPWLKTITKENKDIRGRTAEGTYEELENMILLVK